MKVLPALLLGIALLAQADDNLDAPKTLAKILEKALPRDELQERGPKGEELKYAPNSQAPYTGWTKRVYDNGQKAKECTYKGGMGQEAPRQREGRCGTKVARLRSLFDFLRLSDPHKLPTPKAIF